MFIMLLVLDLQIALSYVVDPNRRPNRPNLIQSLWCPQDSRLLTSRLPSIISFFFFRYFINIIQGDIVTPPTYLCMQCVQVFAFEPFFHGHCDLVKPLSLLIGFGRELFDEIVKMKMKKMQL